MVLNAAMQKLGESLEEKNNNLTSENAAMLTEGKSLAETNNNLLNVITKLKNEGSAIINSQRINITELEAQVSHLQSEIRRLQFENSTMNAEIKNLKALNDENKTKLRLSQQKMNDFEVQITTKDLEKQQFDTNYEKLLSDESDCVRNKDRLRARYENLKRENSNLKQQKRELKEILAKENLNSNKRSRLRAESIEEIDSKGYARTRKLLPQTNMLRK